MIGLYFGGQWFQTTFGNLYGNIELDAVLDENHEWSAEATSNPVEQGAPVTDHVIEQSDKLTIKGFVTDTPLTVSQSLPQISRSQDVFDLLYQLIKLKEPLSVYTKHRVYDEMVLTNVTIPRAAGVGEAIEFTAEFVHVRKVATQMVDVPPGINPKDSAKANESLSRKAQPQKDGGKKQPETKFNTVTRNQSTASRVGEFFSGKQASTGSNAYTVKPYNPG
jgi:hypothetical protein